MANINRTIIVTAALAPLARALAAAQSPGGVGMFETPVYTGANLTHYVSSGLIDERFGALLGDADLLFAAAGGAATLSQCQALVSTSVVVDCDVEGAHATLDRMGVTIWH